MSISNGCTLFIAVVDVWHSISDFWQLCNHALAESAGFKLTRSRQYLPKIESFDLIQNGVSMAAESL